MFLPGELFSGERFFCYYFCDVIVFFMICKVTVSL